MIDITAYHWVWYGLGFVFCPKLTIMIGLSLHIPGIPLPLMILGWIRALLGTFCFRIK